MADRSTKLILVAIALGLFANAGATFLRLGPAEAQSADLSTIQHDLHNIYSGICLNSKIC